MADETFKTPEKTESSVKVVQFLSPSASNYCSSCYKDFRTIPGNPKDVKRKLWYHSKEGDEGLVLTPAGETVQKYMDVKLRKLDLPEICRNCYRSIQNGQEAPVKRRKLFSESRVTSEKFVRNKIKRMVFSPGKQRKKQRWATNDSPAKIHNETKRTLAFEPEFTRHNQGSVGEPFSATVTLS